MEPPCILSMIGQTDPYEEAEEGGWERKGLAIGMDEGDGHGRSGVLIEKVPSANFSFILRISSMGLY